MAVQGVIFDVSHTMLHQGQAVPGMIDAINRLRQLGVQIIAVHNDGSRARVSTDLQRAGIMVDDMVTRHEVGIAKGSPRWIEHIKQRTDLETHELLYVGDSRPDMITASHSKVVYCHAGWVNTNNQYGFLAPTPGWIAAVVAHIFRKSHPWGWSMEYQTPSGRKIHQFALAEVNVLSRLGIKRDLVEMLKDRQEPMVGQISLREFVVLHLTASIYAARLQDTTDIWSVMPSHDGNRISRMSHSLDTIAKLFRDRYEGDLVQRHRAAEHSSNARNQQGIEHAILNQMRTLLVNPALAVKVAEKKILLIDDFHVAGITTGAGRALLRMAGADAVTVVAITKYTDKTHLIGISPDVRWNATQPMPNGSERYIQHREEIGIFHQDSLDEFIASYQTMQQERW